MVARAGGISNVVQIMREASPEMDARYQQRQTQKTAPMKSGKFLEKAGEAARAAGADFRNAFRFVKNHFAPFTRYARDEDGKVKLNAEGHKTKAHGLQHLRSGIGHRITQGIIAAPVVAVGAPLVAAAAAAVVGVAVPVALVGLVGLGIYGAFRSAFQGIRNTKTYKDIAAKVKETPVYKNFEAKIAARREEAAEKAAVKAEGKKTYPVAVFNATNNAYHVIGNALQQLITAEGATAQQEGRAPRALADIVKGQEKALYEIAYNAVEPLVTKEDAKKIALHMTEDFLREVDKRYQEFNEVLESEKSASVSSAVNAEKPVSDATLAAAASEDKA